jgi:hypothetical protein
MKNLPVTLILLLACAGAHGATPVPPKPHASAMLAAGFVMALLSIRHRPRTQLFK